MERLFAIKDEGSKEVIIEIGMAVVAVALLIVFRSQISQLINTLLSKVANVISNIFNESINVGNTYGGANLNIS